MDHMVALIILAAEVDVIIEMESLSKKNRNNPQVILGLIRDRVLLETPLIQGAIPYPKNCPVGIIY